MPKVKKERNIQQIKGTNLKYNVTKHRENMGISEAAVAKMIGRNPGTLNRKLNDPRLFTYEELVVIFKNLKFTDAEILESI